MLDSFLKANLQLIVIEVKKLFREGMITYSMVIQTQYVSLVELVNAQPQSSHDCINKDWLLQQSRWGGRWVNWEGAQWYRCRRHHINPEATVEVVPAFLQKSPARQHLLPLQGGGQCQRVLNGLSSLCSQMDGSSTLAQRSSAPLPAKQSQLFIYDKKN